MTKKKKDEDLPRMSTEMKEGLVTVGGAFFLAMAFGIDILGGTGLSWYAWLGYTALFVTMTTGSFLLIVRLFRKRGWTRRNVLDAILITIALMLAAQLFDLEIYGEQLAWHTKVFGLALVFIILTFIFALVVIAVQEIRRRYRER